MEEILGEEPEEVLSELSLSEDDDLDDLEDDDRERLANMTELEREMEVALKEERLQQKRQRAQLLRKEKKREKEAKDIAEGRKTGTERRSQDAKKAALEQLAAKKRKETGKRSTGRKKADGDDDLDEVRDDDEYAEEEEEQYDDDYGMDDLYGAEDDMDVDADPEPASFLEAKTVQMRRYKMEEWHDKPFFKNAMNGVVVRLAVGSKKSLPGEMEDRNRMSYVCAKVAGVTEREPGYYKFHTSQAWKSPYPFGKGKTSMWLRVVRGGSEKFWPLAQVSNSSITEQEWFHYQSGESQSRDKGGRELTRGDVERARKRLLEAENYTYTEQDVADLLRNKKAIVRNVAIEKARLERERDAAVQRGDEAMAANWDEEIRKLERAGTKRKKEDKMAAVNAKNAKKNFQDGLTFKEDVTGGEVGDEMDPFRRRVTRPMIYWKTKQGVTEQDGSGEAAAAAAAEEEDVVDVREAIRQLVARGGRGGPLYSALYNPNSNSRRRMMSRKFHRSGGDRVRVFHRAEEYLR